MIPFAVVGSEKTIVVGGRQVRGRQNRWGVVNGMFIDLRPLLPLLM
jgi:septin family protein